MPAELISLETGLRLGAFVGVLLVMLLWEQYAPRRQLHAPRKIRWLSNLGIGALNRLLLQLIPLTAAAMLIAAGPWGVFNQIQAPYWITFVVSLIVLDLVVYLQHRLFHAVGPLWRLHRMHHTDTDFDTTTGIRFHPLEAIISMFIKLAAVVVLAPPLFAVVLFEIVLNATSLFNHGNVQLPQRVDRVLRRFLVTPDMHRVHHSIYPDELNRNFGFNLPWWDYLFGTYRAQPADGHTSMQIGLDRFRAYRELYLHRLLTQPFRS